MTEFGPVPAPTPSARAMRDMSVVLGDSNPIHLDPEAVKALGLGDRRVNQGPVNLGYALEAVSAAAQGSRLASVVARFTSNVFEGDVLTVSGTDEGDATRFSLDVAGRGPAVTGVATLDAGNVPSVPESDDQGILVHEGVPVRWWAWGGGDRTLVFVHGGVAHSGWWYPTIRALGDEYRIVAYDSSGHGDSGWRESYSVDGWAEELAAVIRATAPDGAFVMAHSLGTRAGVVTAARYPELVRGLAIIDADIPVGSDENVPPLSPRLYATREEALSRFVLRPDDVVHPDRDLAALAAASIRRVPGGWSWKVDPLVLSRDDAGLPNDTLSAVVAPVACIIAANSDITADFDPADLEAALGRSVQILRVPGAGHHFMVDEPVRTAELISSLHMLRREPEEN